MVALAAAALGALGASPAAAAPSIAELQAQVSRIEAEVEAIDHQVEDAAEAYNGAVWRLQEVQTRIDKNQRTLTRARRDLAAAQRMLAGRLRAAYMQPPPTRIQLILSSRSVSSMLAGAEALERASHQDARILNDVRALRDRTIAARKELVADRARAKEEVADRARQRDQVLGLLRRRQAVLSGAKGRLGTLLAEKRARERREAEARRQAFARSRAQASSGGSGGGSGGGSAGVPAAGGGLVVSGAGSAANARAAQIALRYLGVPYRWGGASPSGGFDCSGLASYAYAQVGKSVPHYTGAIWAKFPRVTGPLQPGDMVFYRGLGHMGIYIGGGQMVHAPRTGDVVKISSMATRSDYVGAVRP